MSINIIIPMTHKSPRECRDRSVVIALFARCSFHTTIRLVDNFCSWRLVSASYRFQKKKKYPTKARELLYDGVFVFVYYDLNHVFAHIKRCTVNQNMGSRTTNLYAE